MAIPGLETHGLWHSAVLTVLDWRRRSAAVAEIEALGADEAGKVLAECGLSRADFAEAMRHTFASSILLPEAMQSLGIDHAAFEQTGAEWNRDMRRTCMLCSHRRQCSDELNSSAFNTDYRDFCPNSASFDALAKATVTQ